MVLYINGKFHTMNDKRSVADAIAVEDGIIRNVSDSCHLVELYPDAEKIDLKAACVIPGIIDTHAHLCMASDSEADREMLIPESVAELIADVKRRASEQEAGTWITYPNTYPLRLDELRFPTKEELDEAAPDHPVAVNGFYATQVNSKALELLDLTVLPPGGMLIRDDDGNLTGTLVNCDAIVGKYNFKREKTSLKVAIKRMMDAYARWGITTTVEGISNLAGIEAVKEIAAEDEQTVRTRYTLMLPRGADYDAIIEAGKATDGNDGALARFSFCKKTVDGGILTGTSLMENGYREKEEIFGLNNIGDDWRGNLVTDIDELEEAIYKTQCAGLQFGAHCVGSGASEKLLQAYERVNKYAPVAEYRHALLHADFMNPEQLKRAADIGVCLLFQPAWHYMDAPFVERITCKAEMDRFLCYRDIEESGIRAGAGSDHMVKLDPMKSCNPYHPFVAMYNMVTCKARDGKAYNQDKKISRDKALAYYTRDAAWTIFDENLTGTLEVGKKADFVVLDSDYFNCAEDEIKDIKPVMTVMDGKIVYSK